MNDWINLKALGQIVVIGLVCGAGLPALFAVGLRLIDVTDPDPAGGEGAVTLARPVSVRFAAAVLCFAVVLAAIGWGIYLIVNSS
jgi:hypothetical protein